MKKLLLILLFINSLIYSMEEDQKAGVNLEDLGLPKELWQLILDNYFEAIATETTTIYEAIEAIKENAPRSIQAINLACKSFRELSPFQNTAIGKDKIKKYFIKLLNQHFLVEHEGQEGLYPKNHAWTLDYKSNIEIAHFIKTGNLRDKNLLFHLTLSCNNYLNNKSHILQLMKLLLFYGIDPNAHEESSPVTTLSLAVQNHSNFSNNLSMINILLKYGANPNVNNIKGISPLAHAVLNHQEKIRVSANISIPESKLITFNQKLIKLLLKYKADPNMQGAHGQTALHFAVALHAPDRNNQDIIALLLEHNANPNIKNSQGYTPLQIAIQNHHETDRNNKDIIVLLLENKADPDIKNDNGKTSIELARERNLDIFNI